MIGELEEVRRELLEVIGSYRKLPEVTGSIIF